MAMVFLVLQCVRCSTMQVKQQKKSSNKWVCAVCNRRQSMLRVHARGHRAADLRRFVQAANMSRGLGASAPEAAWGVTGEQQGGSVREDKRMDWSDYLHDLREHEGGSGDVAGVGSGGLEIEVTTELPQERPKVVSSKRPSKAQLGVADKRPKTPVKPSFSKQQRTEQGSSPSYAIATSQVQTSKWSKYLDMEEGFCGERSGSDSCWRQWAGFDECITTELVVDDEVHPDFL